MADLGLIEAARTGDYASARELIENGADINQQDEQGWTPLCFAAGKGDQEMVKLLIDGGADPFMTGRDNRTPYKIALAAGHVDAVKYLRDVEDQKDPEKAMSLRQERKYSKAYYLKDLRSYAQWSEDRINWKESQHNSIQPSVEFPDDKIVFIHQDFTVTETIWHNENVIFNKTSDEWSEFCSDKLGFKVPTDLDLIVPMSEKSQA